LEGSVNDFALESEKSFFKLTSSTGGPYDITGFLGGVTGRIIYILNKSDFNVNFIHGSSYSAAANQFAFPTISDQILTPDSIITLVYYTDKWYLVSI
jgi:hypothetical protein